MVEQQYVEIIGYMASIFIAISLVMVSVVRLRIINLIGSAFFVVYGILLGALPLVLTNGFIICINLYYLIRIFRRDISQVRYMAVEPQHNHLFDDVSLMFQEKHRDIRRFYPQLGVPHLHLAQKSGRLYVARKRDALYGFALALSLEPGSVDSLINKIKPIDDSLARAFQQLFLANPPEEERSAMVFIADYVVPRYRDLGLAGEFHRQLQNDLSPGVGVVYWAMPEVNRGMKRIISNLGFDMVTHSSGYQLYRKTLSAVPG